MELSCKSEAGGKGAPEKQNGDHLIRNAAATAAGPEGGRPPGWNHFLSGSPNAMQHT